MTVREAVEQYIEARIGAGITPGTEERYRVSLKAICASGLGKLNVRAVTKPEIEAYFSWRDRNVWQTRVKAGGIVTSSVSGRRAANATKRKDRPLLSSALLRLIDMKVVKENPLRKIKIGRAKTRIPKPIPKDHLTRLIQHTAPELEPIIIVGVDTGLRSGEIIKLRWVDVDLRERTLLVTRDKDHSQDLITLHRVAVERLKSLRETRARLRGAIPPPTEHVFLSRYGRPYAEKSNFKQAWKGAIKRAELTEYGYAPHAMRHTFATHFTGPVHELQKTLGHSDLKTTLNYLRSLRDVARQSMDNMDLGLDWVVKSESGDTMAYHWAYHHENEEQRARAEN